MHRMVRAVMSEALGAARLAWSDQRDPSAPQAWGAGDSQQRSPIQSHGVEDRCGIGVGGGVDDEVGVHEGPQDPPAVAFGVRVVVVQGHVSALTKTTNQLFRKAQGAKHASNVELKLVQTYLVSAESILRQLVVHS